MNESDEKKSSILLLCLGFDQPKQVVSGIRVRDLLNVFQPFGSLRKIMIFSKTTIVKAFIEFADADSAELAKDTLHETNVDSFGRARLYFSNREQIVCSNNFLDYWDSGLQVCREGLTLSTKEEPLSVPASPIGRELPVDGEPLSPLKQPPSSSRPGSGPLNFSSSPFEPDRTDENRWVLGENKVLLKRFSLNAPLTPGRLNDGSFGEGMLPFDLRPVPVLPSKVVLVSNLENFFGSAKEVFNLFSSFGNLNKILLMKNLQKALIEFGSIESAQRCIDHINRKQIDGLSLRVSFSKYQKIDLKKSNKSENSQQYNDVFLVSPEFNRFALGEAKFVPPSQVILVVLEKKGDINNTDACLLVKDSVKALGVSTFGEKIDYQDSKFVKIAFNMQSLQNAFLVISKLHGTNVKNCPLSVNFCA